MTARCHRRGFTITEMLAVLILMSAFAVIATRLFTTSVKLTFTLGNAQDAAASVDGAIALLRTDVASAKEISVADGTITLGTVTWTLQDQRFIRRDGTREQVWRAPSPKATFTSDGSTVVLKIPETDASVRFGEIWLTSQHKVLDQLTHP